MAKLDYGRWWLNIKSPDLRQCLLKIQQATNYVDDGNVRPGSLTGASIQDASIPLKKLNWLEWPITLFKAMPAASTTSSVDGGYFLYDPNKFPDGKWYLEAVMQVTSGGTASMNLKIGSTVIATVNVTATSWTLSRSSAIANMPTSQTVLTCTLTSSGTSYTASALGASLIYVPN